MRFVALLVLGLVALELSMRMSGQSAVDEIRAWMQGPEAVVKRRVDIAAARRLLLSGPSGEVQYLVHDLRQDQDAARQLVDEIVAALDRLPTAEQRMLVGVLMNLRKDAARAAPAIARLARAADAELRVGAIRAVSLISDDPGPLLPTGAEMIAGLDGTRHFHLLSKLEGLHPDIVDRILRARVDSRMCGPLGWDILSNAKHLGPRLPDFTTFWLGQVDAGGTPDQRLQKINAAEHIGRGTVAWLEPFLADPDPYVRLAAALARLRVEPDGPREPERKLVLDYLPRWAACAPPGDGAVSRGEAWIHTSVLRELRVLKGRIPNLGALLSQRMRCCEPLQRDGLYQLIEEQGLIAETLPALLAAMEQDVRRDRDCWWIQKPGRACVKLGPAGDAAIPILVRGLDAKRDRFHVSSFVSVLGAFGPRAREALPRLRELANAPDPSTARSARDAIARITGESR